jgi:4-amino-4-deoxy-L-arabinose transferase-like glycosyltransferase
LWRLVILLLLALIVGRFVVIGAHKVLANSGSSDGDESAYLELGLALREEGILSDGTRPPLYPLLIAPFAGREWAYFTNAKLLTLGLGVLTILAAFGIGLRRFGWETALLAAFLLAANKEFHLRATTVYADTLLALVILGGWYYLVKSLEEGGRAGVLAGIFVGLAFLTKGSAPVLLAAWGLTALLRYRLQIFRRYELLLVPVAFVVVSLPLLYYNAVTFGSPTYNFATSHIMWMDRLEEINAAAPEELPTFSSYLASHTPADVAARIAKGLRRLNPVVAATLNPNREFEPAWVGPALGGLAGGIIAFLLLFKRPALRAYLSRHKLVLWFTFFLNGLFYSFFVWYVAGSSAETRFIIPLLGPLYLLLADGVVSLLRGASRQRLTWPALALLIGGGTWWLVETTRAEAWAISVDPYASDRAANADVEDVVGWLSRDTTAEASVIFGPSKSLPLWKFPPNFTFERIPSTLNTWPALRDSITTQDPTYIILDDDTVRRRRDALAGYFQRQEGRITFEQIPPGWRLDYLYPGLPAQWLIFSPATGYAQPLATFAGGLELLDANTKPPVWVDGKRVLRVTLTWRAERRQTEDYTIFVHLTAPDGFVKAQHDRPPFAGAYPTSHWQAGKVVADRYDLILDGSVTSGDYLLLAGLYRPATGERLPLLAGPAGPSPAAVLLTPLKIAE